MPETTLPFPPKGKSKEEVLAAMREVQKQDIQWQQGKAFSLVFHAGQEVDELLKEAFTLFFSENGLNPAAFPSLRKFETEVVAMAADLLHGDSPVVGSMTSGGTESILMAVKSARDWARRNRPEVKEPEMILPRSAHPAFEKAAQYLGVRAIFSPVGENFRADVEATKALISSNTILLAGSAPAYPHGVVDPIAELSELAHERGLLFHVDACVGGFMLPFVRRLGYPVPDFDFRLPGVTSMSADLHKYAYAAKGASLILYRDPELRRCGFFVSTEWPGGIYPSPTIAGTRSGGVIAAAWAVLNFLGEEGYTEIAATVMKAVEKIRVGIAAIPGLKVLGEPEMSVMAIASDRLNIYEVGDELAERGWHLDRQQFPPSLHLTINYAHTGVVDDFLRDLAASTEAASRWNLRKAQEAVLLKIASAAVRLLPEQTVTRLMSGVSGRFGGGDGSVLPGRQAAMYGLMGSLPNRGDLEEVVLDLLDSMTRLKGV